MNRDLLQATLTVLTDTFSKNKQLSGFFLQHRGLSELLRVRSFDSLTEDRSVNKEDPGS